MKIKVSDKKWYSRTQFHNMERLAKHVMEHYPKDSALHKAVWSCFKSCEQTERKLWTGWKAGSKASKTTAKPRRKSTARRRTTARYAPAKRRTVRRSTAKRRTTTRRTARRSAPKRRTAARRTIRRTAHRTRRSA